jgi:hypothetical protein|tara:strand:+ start:467 stop:1087 length:621 start_codon:yes stop_codon:yes gene_type:complete
MKNISICLDEGQLKEITKQVRDSGGADNRFDVNLLEGKLSEDKWAELLETVEFKKDYKAWKTGNVAVEYANGGKSSGIAVTQAKFVAYILVDEQQNENAAIFLRTEVLRGMCRQYLGNSKRDVKGGDNHESSLILLPLEELLNPEFLFGTKKEEPDVYYGDNNNGDCAWTYVCPQCSLRHGASVKNLHKNCPRCISSGIAIKMVID